MASNADIGIGNKFQIGNGGGPETFADLAELVEFTPPETARDAVEVTHSASPNRHREFKPGLIDAGEVVITYNLIPGGPSDDSIRAQFDDALLHNFRCVYANGGYLQFAGFCTSSSKAAPIDDKMTGEATFKISGKPTWTDPA